MKSKNNPRYENQGTLDRGNIPTEEARFYFKIRMVANITEDITSHIIFLEVLPPHIS